MLALQNTKSGMGSRGGGGAGMPGHLFSSIHTGSKVTDKTQRDSREPEVRCQQERQRKQRPSRSEPPQAEVIVADSAELNQEEVRRG